MSGGDPQWSGGDPLQIHTKEDQWFCLVGITIKKLGAENKNGGAIFTIKEKRLQTTNEKEELPLTTADQATPQPEDPGSLLAPVMIEVDTEVNSGPGHETRYQPTNVTPQGSPRELPLSLLQ